MKIVMMLAGLSVACMGIGLKAGETWGLIERPALSGCTAVDGDTIRCRTRSGAHERIRLLGIDAPELPGHCRKGRNCAIGDPDLSRFTLEVGMDRGEIRAEKLKKDRYGRWIAVVHAGDLNLSCWQIDQQQAMYMRPWDDGGRVDRACGGRQ